MILQCMEDQAGPSSPNNSEPANITTPEIIEITRSEQALRCVLLNMIALFNTAFSYIINVTNQNFGLIISLKLHFRLM